MKKNCSCGHCNRPQSNIPWIDLSTMSVVSPFSLPTYPESFYTVTVVDDTIVSVGYRDEDLARKIRETTVRPSRPTFIEKPLNTVIEPLNELNKVLRYLLANKARKNDK